MLRMTPSTSSEGAKKYFDDALSQADYYLKDQTAVPSLWGGKGASKLGLAGQVARESFHALCDNLNPVTGEKLTPRTNKVRRVGYDFTFSVPKGVSVLHALGDERIAGAFNDAVRETMAEIEQDMETRVRKGGAWENRNAGNLTWAAFTHNVSRPVDGVPDMHLHQHVYCFNAVFDPVEGRWKAGEFGNIKRDAPYWESVFDARLALKLRDLGYGIERTAQNGKTGWDMARVPESVKVKFSRRTQEIEALAQKLGIKTDALKSTLGARSREHKNPEMTAAQLKAIWESRLTDGERDALAGSSGDRTPKTRVTAKEAMDYALDHCFARASVVADRELMRDALKRGVGSVSPEDVRAQLGRDDILLKPKDGHILATWSNVLEEEKACIDFVRSGRGQCAPLRGQKTEAGNQKAGSVVLNDQQRAAVEHVLSSHDRLMAIKGAAGVGKTTLMTEAVRGIEEGGHKVFTFAPSSDASRGVLQQEGFENATTLAELLHNEKLQAEIKNQVIWIDEAGMVGTKTLKQVTDLAERQHCRVVLSGDYYQHASPERGEAFRLLVEHAGLKPAIVSEIQRQKDTGYREAVYAMSRGDALDGFTRLEKLGAVLEMDDEGKRYASLAKTYAEAVTAKETVLVVSPTHAEGALVTNAIRSELKAGGLIGNEEKPFLSLRNLQWTDAERSDAARYHPGLVVQFTQNAKGFTKGERFTVEKVEGGRVWLAGKPLPLDKAERFQVYEAGAVALAMGDKVRITANGETLPDRQGNTHRLNNGAIYSVAGFTKGGGIKLADEKGVRVVSGDFGHLAYGFCSTSHASQGKTAKTVLIAASSMSFPAISREGFYVSSSRGKKTVKLYTDDREALRDAVQASGGRMSATEFMSEAGKQKPEKSKVLDFKEWGERVNRLKAYARAKASWTKAASWASRIGRNREQPEMER